MRGLGLLIVVALLLVSCSSPSTTRVVVGAGTTLVDSQFMLEIAAAYQEVEPTTELSVIGLSSAEAIALASSGDADVIITHNRDALDAFLGEHPEAERVDVFASSFFVAADPLIELVVGSIDEAFALIASNAIEFISRDDGSGTNAAELATWKRISVEPFGESWYSRTGTGMGATLQVTDQRHATTLAEHGAFLASEAMLSLVPVAGTVVENPYDVTVIDPLGNDAAAAFVAWITSAEGVAAIERANLLLFGEQVYAAP